MVRSSSRAGGGCCEGAGSRDTQRYILTLFGNAQKLELQPWQAADEMTVRVPFAWNADTWYRMKLRVENLADGHVHVRGKVWPAAEPELFLELKIFFG